MTDAVKEVANNDVLKQAVAKIIEKSLQGIDTATSFLSAQLPDVIHQLLMWKAVSSFIIWCTSIFLIISTLILAKAIKNAEENLDTKKSVFWLDKGYSKGDVTFIGFMSIVYCIVADIIGLAMFICNWTWLKIWIAPKIYLIEYAASLVK